MSIHTQTDNRQNHDVMSNSCNCYELMGTLCRISFVGFNLIPRGHSVSWQWYVYSKSMQRPGSQKINNIKEMQPSSIMSYVTWVRHWQINGNIAWGKHGIRQKSVDTYIGCRLHSICNRLVLNSAMCQKWRRLNLIELD